MNTHPAENTASQETEAASIAPRLPWTKPSLERLSLKDAMTGDIGQTNTDAVNHYT